MTTGEEKKKKFCSNSAFSRFFQDFLSLYLMLYLKKYKKYLNNLKFYEL
jgi:hypothetical protein